MANVSEITRIAQKIHQNIEMLLGPISRVAREYKPKEFQNYKKVFLLDFIHLSIKLSRINFNITDPELMLIKETTKIFGPNDNRWYYESIEDIRKDIIVFSFQHSGDEDFSKMTPPMILVLTQLHDQKYGTHFTISAKKMFFDYADALVKIDGIVEKEASEFLEQYLEVLSNGEKHDDIVEKEQDIITGSGNPSHSPDCSHNSLEEILKKIEELTGLDNAKNDIKELVNFIRIQKIREEKGLPEIPLSLHLIFTGNPGTGKTMMARLLAEIYKEIGVISKGHLVETDRAGMVAGFVGQTAIKVTDVVNKAIGGILFIDEAYMLAGDGMDYGQEAIDTLLKLMEDHRDELVVIVAGYPERMNKFINSNPGLQSRFSKYIHFDDYTAEQLSLIFASFCKKNGLVMTDAAKEKLSQLFITMVAHKDDKFGNARAARNIFEKVLNNQANRIIKLPVTEKTLITIEDADIPICDITPAQNNFSFISSMNSKLSIGKLKFICPNCNKNLMVAEEYRGRNGQCPNCKHTFNAPNQLEYQHSN